jgi:hypothetical protein
MVVLHTIMHEMHGKDICCRLSSPFTGEVPEAQRAEGGGGVFTRNSPPPPSLATLEPPPPSRGRISGEMVLIFVKTKRRC